MSVFDEAFAVVEKSYLRIGRPSSVLAAVSGGIDSVALLLLLAGLQKKYAFQLRCVHVNHGLREDAALDEILVKNLCNDVGVAYECIHLHLQLTSNVESAARTARYAALRQCKENYGADVIAVGHHMDDQAETILMHLMYGSGSRGMRGMMEINQDVWRPLLTLRQNDLAQILVEKNVTWREDSTNADSAYTRNALRLDIMPRMEKVYPAFVSSMSRAASILSDEHDMLHQQTDQWLRVHGFFRGDVRWFMRAPFLTEHIALQRRIILHFFSHAGLELQFDQVERVRQAIKQNDSSYVNISGNNRVYVSETRVHFITPYLSTWPLGDIVFKSPAVLLGDGHFTQAFDADMITRATLRYRKPGDRMTPLGASGSQTLKQYMIDKKIERPFRHIWPVLAIEDDVLWVIGRGISSKAAINNKTKNTCYAAYKGLLPDGTNMNGGQEHA